jgi:hypothetical protein
VVEAAEVVPATTEEESGQREASGPIVYFHGDCWHDAMPKFEFRRRGRLRDLFPDASAYGVRPCIERPRTFAAPGPLWLRPRPAPGPLHICDSGVPRPRVAIQHRWIAVRQLTEPRERRRTPAQGLGQYAGP